MLKFPRLKRNDTSKKMESRNKGKTTKVINIWAKNTIGDFFPLKFFKIFMTVEGCMGNSVG